MKIAVIIPSYRVSQKILSVIQGIGSEVSSIYVVDDACPEHSGEVVRKNCSDPRVKILINEKNQGAGGATLRGFKQAYEDGNDILVKLDGDGQMNPALIPGLTRPLRERKADYTKGNRFYSLQSIGRMPALRLIGNAGIGFLAKITTGYWYISDPNNGYVALCASLFPHLEPERIAKRYFFENDMLFRLAILRAVVVDIPMVSHYADENSSLSVVHSLFSFPFNFTLRFIKRIGYRYFLRDFNIGSVMLLAGTILMLGGGYFGLYHWVDGALAGKLASSGTVMLSALPILLGFQMLIFWIVYDVLTIPNHPVQEHL